MLFSPQGKGVYGSRRRRWNTLPGGTAQMHDENLLEPFERLEVAAELVMERAEASARRVAYERGNRLSLLWIHGIVASVAGLQQILYGSATQLEVLLGPWVRLFLGPVAIIGGLILLSGLLKRPRSIPMEAVGLSFVALWDGSMTLGLGAARILQNNYHVIPFGQQLPAGYVPAYPIAVYGGMFALLVVHLWTLRLLKRHVLPTEQGGVNASQ